MMAFFFEELTHEIKIEFNVDQKNKLFNKNKKPPEFQVVFVTQSGFEPETYCLEGSCSIQLSYWANRRGGRIGTCGLLLPKQAR